MRRGACGALIVQRTVNVTGIFVHSRVWRSERGADHLTTVSSPDTSMHLDPELIDAMVARHGASGPWEELPSTGVANRIFATTDVVLRVATDHPEAVPDARTESIAAPVAHAAGILTPR